MNRKNIFLTIVIFFLFSTSLYAHDYVEDNLEFKRWCKETFKYGVYVYEGYKAVAFLKFVSEPPNTDFWQTPIKTYEKQEGDCEDAAFLFLDYLPRNQDAEIIWGWVYKRDTCIWFAHVWCELIARDGNRYVVEGFSNWEGIKLEKLESETRMPVLELPLIEYNKLNDAMSLKWDICKESDYVSIFNGDSLHYGDMIFLQKNLKVFLGISETEEIKRILRKLQEFFLRKEKQ